MTQLWGAQKGTKSCGQQAEPDQGELRKPSGEKRFLNWDWTQRQEDVEVALSSIFVVYVEVTRLGRELRSDRGGSWMPG